MLALARTGQRSAALAQYARCRRVLRAEFGVEPSAETAALHERIRLAMARPRHNLPAAATDSSCGAASACARPLPSDLQTRLRWCSSAR